MRGPTRCRWVGDDDLYTAYHDDEWGVPVLDDRVLFEFITLEGAQAGLSWLTILRKRAHYRAVFEDFDPARVAEFDQDRVEKLLQDPGIVRNRMKVESTVRNARAFLGIQAEYGTFARYLWGFVDGKPIQNRWASLADVPTETEESRRLSRDLKRRGFNFVGPTICYAYMQAVGLVNDHETGCFRYDAVRELGEQMTDWGEVR
ncbi:MAG: DNA-3-methyladenine glycosylase I [Chloroflexota bacterium]